MTTPVAILAATGTVGQKLIAMVERHPDFYVGEIAASPKNAGKIYRDACTWREKSSLPENVGKMVLKNCLDVESPFVLSALPGDMAGEVEPALAEKGIHVISNASAMRMEANVPLMIPEINGDHISLVDSQSTKGKIITNPNCATVFLSMGLAPLMSLGKITHVSVVTLQAISGAGYPGIPSMDIMGNIIPFIGGEEDKINQEALKILGSAGKDADFSITTHVHRVPVIHGHTVAMHVSFDQDVKVDDALSVLNNWEERFPKAFKIYTEEDRPQPAKDLTEFDQFAHIGRIKQGGRKNIIGLISMGHNLVRGAAGAAIANLELAVQKLKV
ncbi:MAG: aspartate-semialdehyde dehydrogenase [Bacteriovoracaceae bacterium]|nr:aspartate-semialdehyde dehydrogenase [Bacteriovoracaceae bacterium]